METGFLDRLASQLKVNETPTGCCAIQRIWFVSKNITRVANINARKLRILLKIGNESGTRLWLQNAFLRAWPYIAGVRTRIYGSSNPIPPLPGMAIPRTNQQDDEGGFMKKFLVVSALVLSSSCLASAQSIEPQTRDNTATRYDEPRHNFGWIGLLGLVGLMGLRRQKSEAAQRFESRGVKVNAV